MAEIKISELDAAAAALAAMELEVNDNGTSRKITVAQLLALAYGSTPGLLASLGAGTAAARTLETSTADQLQITNPAGTAGNPSLALVLANQGEAEAGDNAKLMTAERVKQAITAQAGSGGGWVYDSTPVYDFAEDGAVAQVEIDLDDGFDYLLLLDGIKGSRSGGRNIRVHFYDATNAVWSAQQVLVSAVTFTTGSGEGTQSQTTLRHVNDRVRGMWQMLAPRRAARHHFIQPLHVVTAQPSTPPNSAGFPVTTPTPNVQYQTPAAISKLRISWSTGNIDGGAIRLAKRPYA